MRFMFAAALLGAAMAVRAQDPATRMDKFDERLSELEKKYKLELEKRDAVIEDLRREVKDLRQRPASEPASRPSGIDSARDAVIADILEKRSGFTGPRQSASLNPDIAVIADFLGTIGRPRSNDAYNRLDIREVELDIRAAVHPKADGVLILAFERDVENPVFAEEGEEEHGVESSVNIEEAYIFLHDLGIKNFTAKVGRFHVRFGRQNLLHLHDLPTADAPLVNQALLSPESLNDAGVSLSWLVPNPWNQYIEVIGEFLSGEGADSESPVLQGSLEVDSPAINLHALWNTDLASNINMELGGSFLMGHANEQNSLDVKLYGLDFTILRRDPLGGFNNQFLQAELIYGDVDQEESTQHALGAYLIGQQQINRDWYAGLRVDWTQNPHDDRQEAWGVSPYVTWYWTEFLRFRAQYQYRDGDIEESHVLFLQATWLFGAHPAHPYWTAK